MKTITTPTIQMFFLKSNKNPTVLKGRGNYALPRVKNCSNFVEKFLVMKIYRFCK